jgi:hypothetical protein
MLGSLEQVRRERVHQAQAELARRRAELLSSGQLLDDLGRTAVELAQKSTRALAFAATASDVADMRSAAEHLRSLRASAADLGARRRAAEAVHAGRAQALQAAERALVEAELGRRAVGNMIERKASAEARRRELSDEEAAADLARARE